QPYLNIEAIRNPENTANNVIAGVRVTGLADKPKVEIFSEPAFTQQEALSYLLRGEGLDKSGDTDSSQMTAMLIGLGVGQSGQLVGRIGETFGVSDLALDTQGVGDSSQVVVSGKITNDLQVKYGVGIFDSLATLTLRYRLMPRLYLQAVSGMNQAIDLLYQFEF
ncbi:translocation/assembly module TamB domain-containing protein, partial [Escherichia coli]|nr:translocation/assembly module TamB domain-containing protein [Escherichia coli]